MTKFKHNNTFRRAALTLLALIMTCAAAWADSITYIDENGQTQTVNAEQFTSETSRLYSNTWYYVSGTVNCPDNRLYLMQVNETHNLILCDGATLTLQEIESLHLGVSKLSVYGQSGGTGKLNVGDGSVTNAILNCELTVNGGQVTLTGSSSQGSGIDHNVVFNGGKLTATGRNNGIDGNTTINATSGWINASKYGGSVTIADGKYMKDETGRCYKGTLTDAEKAAAAGKTLQPATQAEYIQYYLGTGNDGSAQHPYTISDAISWNVFCDAFEDNDTWNHFSSGFSGKIVKLGANISVSRMAGNDAHPFTGTFNGDGKTLTFNYGSEGTPSNEDYIAPFRYTDGATISGLHVSGNIYTQHTHSAGIIGLASGTTTVSNCRSSINIISSINGDGTHGGLIACTWTGSTTNITGCLFDGSIQSASGYATDQCGGFVGWRNATINVTNCLLTADLSTIGVGASYPSCTFVRNGLSSITNSYYTQALGEAQGTQRRTVSAGDYVTCTVSPVGSSTASYSVSGITAYDDGLVRDGNFYYGNGDAVSLTLANNATAPLGYQYTGYIASDGTLSGTTNPYTLTMADANVTVSVDTNGDLSSTGQPVSVSYMNADGTTAQASAIALDGSMTTLNGTYYVGANITFTNTITLTGDLTLILANGKTMNVGTSDNRISGSGIKSNNNKNYTLTIYGQSLDEATAGHLSIYNNGEGINLNSYNQQSGNVTVNSTTSFYTINCYYFTLSGGKLNAINNHTDGNGINGSNQILILGGQLDTHVSNNRYSLITFSGSITLGWTNASDYIYASSYSGTVNIAEGKTLLTDDNPPVQVSGNNISASTINGKTLTPDYSSHFSQNGNEFTIMDAIGWNVFCDLLAAEDGKTFFSGKTVKLGANISVTRMAGSSGHEFCGTFDGNHNTLTFTATAADNYVAPFNSVQGTSAAHAIIKDLNVVTSITADGYRHMAGLVAVTTGYVDVRGCNATVNISSTVALSGENTSDLYPAGLVSQAAKLSNNGKITFSHCAVSGTISTNGKYAAGLIGTTQCEAAVSDCRSSVTIESSTVIAGNHDGSHGGLIGVTSGGVVTIEGCLFNGSLLSDNGTNCCGGFIGWRNSGTEIRNSLFDPTEVTVENEGSATFARNNVDTYNSYYTYLLNDGTHYKPEYVESSSVWRNGRAPRTVTGGANVTVSNIALTGTETEYTTSGITAYSGGGIQRGGTLYYGSDDAVSLTLANNATGAPAGYQYSGYTASDGTLSGTANPYTLTMPNANVTINVDTDALQSTGLPVSVTYMNADGTTGSHEAIALDGNETMPLAANQWYYIGKDINYSQTVSFQQGDITLILGDGCTMNIGTGPNDRVNGIGIDGYESAYASLTIYGQSLDDATAGHLCIFNTGNNRSGIDIVGPYTQHSGNVSVNSNGTGMSGAISCYYDFTLNGGTIDANSSNYQGIKCYNNIAINGGKLDAVGQEDDGLNGNNITLNWTNVSDYIHVSRYYTKSGGTLSVAEGKAFIDGNGNIYSGTINKVNNAYPIDGKTLYPRYVPYLDENGQQQLCAEYTVLTGTETTLGTAGQETWYVANTYYNYNHKLSLTGDVHLILCDGAQVYLSQEYDDDVYYDVSIKGDDNLTIYGQTNGTGTLNSYMIFTNGAITINGGTINVYGNDLASILTKESFTVNGGTINTSYGDKGIYVIPYGPENPEVSYNCTINGGTLTIAGISNGIYANGDVIINGGLIAAVADEGNGIRAKNLTLGWTYATDYIYANSYSVSNNKTVVAGKVLTDNAGHIYCGTLNYAQLEAMFGNTLYPLVNAVTRTIEGYGDSDGGYYLIASPFEEVTPTTGNGFLTNEYDLYAFDESEEAEWRNYEATPFNLESGRGYLYASQQSTTLVFSGTPYTGSGEVTLTKTEGAEFSGWNLIGNPFNANATLSQPYYRMNADGTALNTETESTAVAAMEGVFVQAAEDGDIVTFTAQTRGSEHAAIAQANIMVVSDNGTVIDNAIVRFDDGQTLEKFSMRQGSTRIYLMQDGKEYAIATVGSDVARNVSTTNEIPVNFKAEKNGTYTLSFSSQEVSFSYLHLIDNLTGNDIDLLDVARNVSTAPTYTFTAKTTDYESRFKLVFAVNDGPSTGSGAFAYYNGSEWVIGNPSTGSGAATLQVIDVLGHVLRSETINCNTTINTNGLSAGVYVMRLINGEDVRVQKVVVR